MKTTKLTLSNEAADLMADMAYAKLAQLQTEHRCGLLKPNERKNCRAKMVLVKEILDAIPTR